MSTVAERAAAFGDLEAPISNVLHIASICRGLMEDLANNIHGFGKLKCTATELADLVERDVDNLIFAVNQADGFARALHAQYHADEVVR